MTADTTTLPLSEAKARLSELARRVRTQHERVTVTRNGVPEVVIIDVDDLDGLELTLEILADAAASARIAQALDELVRGEVGADLDTMRAVLARRRAGA